MYKKIHKFMKQNRTQNIWRAVLSPKPPASKIRNRRAFRKWWRSFKKEGELMFPIILLIIVLGMIGYLMA